jgi:hypothetical protein
MQMSRICAEFCLQVFHGVPDDFGSRTAPSGMNRSNSACLLIYKQNGDAISRSHSYRHASLV